MSDDSFVGLVTREYWQRMCWKTGGTVYFDENDFEDDANLEIDVEESPLA